MDFINENIADKNHFDIRVFINKDNRKSQSSKKLYNDLFN